MLLVFTSVSMRIHNTLMGFRLLILVFICDLVHKQNRTITIGNETTAKCNAGAPFDNLVHHVNNVFVVAEVDDTYVYHTHLGGCL